MALSSEPYPVHLATSESIKPWTKSPNGWPTFITDNDFTVYVLLIVSFTSYFRKSFFLLQKTVILGRKGIEGGICVSKTHESKIMLIHVQTVSIFFGGGGWWGALDFWILLTCSHALFSHKSLPYLNFGDLCGLWS